MDSNPYFRWAASWIGFTVGVLAWTVIVDIVGVIPLYVAIAPITVVVGLVGMGAVGCILGASVLDKLFWKIMEGM